MLTSLCGGVLRYLFVELCCWDLGVATSRGFGCVEHKNRGHVLWRFDSLVLGFSVIVCYVPKTLILCRTFAECVCRNCAEYVSIMSRICVESMSKRCRFWVESMSNVCRTCVEVVSNPCRTYVEPMSNSRQC